MVKQFEGFSDGTHKTLPIPAQFFSELLPLIDDTGELKVTLFCFRALRQVDAGGRYHYFLYDQFRSDEDLMRGLMTLDRTRDPDDLLKEALAKTIARGTLLTHTLAIEPQPLVLYCLNTESGRRAIAQLKSGNWQPDLQKPIEILPERPNAFTLYEQNIGPLTAHISDALRDAEREYGDVWLKAAIRIAIENNVRRWRYIQRILEAWKQEGHNRHEEPARYAHQNGHRTVSPYAKLIEP